MWNIFEFKFWLSQPDLILFYLEVDLLTDESSVRMWFSHLFWGNQMELEQTVTARSETSTIPRQPTIKGQPTRELLEELLHQHPAEGRSTNCFLQSLLLLLSIPMSFDPFGTYFCSFSTIFFNILFNYESCWYQKLHLFAKYVPIYEEFDSCFQ